jgi:hypothetical protein
MSAVLASSRKERGTLEGAPVHQRLRSLLRRARPRKSRRRVSRLVLCTVLASLLVPAGAGWSAPPTPDPAPPGRETEGTTLQPDVRPTPPKPTPPKTDAASPPRTAEAPATPRSAEAPVQTRSAEQPAVEAPVETRTVEQPVSSRSSVATAEPPPPPPPAVAPQARRPRPATARQKPVRASTPRARPERRRFAALEKQRRWQGRDEASRVPTVDVVALVSSDPESRPYGAAAFSLAVLVLGSATLLIVLARLRATGRRLA